jgi:hypothetical protein
MIENCLIESGPPCTLLLNIQDTAEKPHVLTKYTKFNTESARFRCRTMHVKTRDVTWHFAPCTAPSLDILELIPVKLKLRGLGTIPTKRTPLVGEVSANICG